MKDNEKKEIAILTERIILGQVFRIYGTVEKPMFLVADIARAIEASNPTHLSNIVDDANKLKAILPLHQIKGQDSYGGLRANTECTFVTEAGLYKILMRSDKPKAQPFQDKVCEILKEIRQTGGYIHTEPDDDDDMILARAFVVAQRKIEQNKKQIAEQQTKILEQQEKIDELEPKAEYTDLITDSEGTMTATILAKDFGMSAPVFNLVLHYLHVQYESGNTWKLYAEYEGKGYTKNLKGFNQIDNSRRVGYVNMRWTQAGAYFVHELFKENADILPAYIERAKKELKEKKIKGRNKNKR